MTNKHRALPVVLWLVGILTCLLVIVQTHFVADLSAFMPRTPNARQQLLIDQLHDGAVARLIMMGIEGGDAAERACLRVGARDDPADGRGGPGPPQILQPMDWRNEHRSPRAEWPGERRKRRAG